MKKSILIFSTVLVSFSLMAIGYMNWGNPSMDLKKASLDNTVKFKDGFINPFSDLKDPELVYNISNRYIATVTKEVLNNAKTIIDILPEEATKNIDSYQQVDVTVLLDGEEPSEIGGGEVLNPAQKNLLRTTDYSSNIHIRADYRLKNEYNNNLVDRNLVYFITVVPEKLAEYADGKEALIEYLRENSKKESALIKRKDLKPGRVSFTVTKKGNVSKLKLDATSGHNIMDNKLFEMLNNLPAKWIPAKNSKGEKVDQELIFFFGLEGC